MIELANIVRHFMDGLCAVDAMYPKAQNVRTKEFFKPGIGPHSEADTVRFVMAHLASGKETFYRFGSWETAVPYPESPQKKCDLCIGRKVDAWEWAIEVKMLRLLGDNGKLNDNMLMHILSPYAAHRSALTDCDKLTHSSL